MTSAPAARVSMDAGRALPPPVLVVSIVASYLLALHPGTLPRDAATTAVVTSGFAAVGAVVGMLLSRWASRRRPHPDTQTRRVVFGAGVLIAAGGAGLSVWWQSLIRAAVGAPPVGPDWWVAATVAPAAAVAAIVLIPRVTAVIAASAVALTAGLLAPADAGADRGQPLPRTVVVSEFGTLLRGELAAPEFDRPAERLVRSWMHSGGLSARAVIVAVPTGSGWVDPAAVAGFVDRFDGDVRILTLPYADVPSWKAFISGDAAATESSITLVRELAKVLASRSAGARPRLVLYGQSLGAVGADAARVWLEDHHPSLLAETVLTAPPAGTVAQASRTPRIVMANRSDPVVRWSLGSLWRPPAYPDDTVLGGRRVPEVPWLPVVGFLQSSVDLLAALDGPTGVGHRYGTEQARPVSGLPR
ncbi:alpha/beta-hydrolase family protein [Gordonia amicalis]|uniref:alpha/beta-hydrolase family protein n=1 Tax=Gordonia amicalis TaxID=89053 RepID=UPI0022A79C01|nr:alpha/beta-hydrolase family protein [Gordonia amicalis]MCZ0913918.1 alpha/beta-hydrolase family protein [Gordonia amicalis]